MAGGWEAAANLPADVALAMAEDHIRSKVHSRHAQALQIWAAMFPAYRGGGTPPKPPEPPDF